MVLKNEKGQTVVEYILLLAVVVSLVTTFYRSKIFQKLFGEQGTIGSKIKTEAEFGYRHAYINGATVDNPDNYPGTSHPSYYDPKTSTTRFFGPKNPYQ
jgi:hypothetical protein